jgi:hypothetical protein
MTPIHAVLVYLALAGTLLVLFMRGDGAVSPAARASFAGWLARRDADWMPAFLAWFDRVFRVRRVELPVVGALHLPSFFRSVAASFFALALLATVWVLRKDTLSRDLRFREWDALPWSEMGLLLAVYGGATVISNWIPDYLSLVQSRWVMERMAKSSRALHRIGWLVADAVGTAAVAFGSIYLGMVLLLPVASRYLTLEVGCLTPEAFGLAEAWQIFVAGLTFQTPPGTLNYDAAGIYVYSTFMTSLWVWITLASGLLLRASIWLRRVATPSERPLRRVGVVALVAFTGIFWTAWLGTRGREVDVVVFGTGADEAHAAALTDQLQEAGFTVRRAQPQLAFNGRALRGADLVVVAHDGMSLDAFRPDVLARREALERSYEAQVRAGVRPSGTRYHAFAGVDAEVRTEAQLAVVSWARLAPSLLAPWQLRVCVARFGEEAMMTGRFRENPHR